MDFYLAKHGLNKTWDLRQIGLSFLRDQKHGEEGGEEEKREEEEEEEKKKRGRRSQDQRYGTTNFEYGTLNFCMELQNLSMDLWFCMIIILPKPWVLLGFHLNPKIMENMVGKTLYDTRWL